MEFLKIREVVKKISFSIFSILLLDNINLLILKKLDIFYRVLIYRIYIVKGSPLVNMKREGIIDSEIIMSYTVTFFLHNQDIVLDTKLLFKVVSSYDECN